MCIGFTEASQDIFRSHRLLNQSSTILAGFSITPSIAESHFSIRVRRFASERRIHRDDEVINVDSKCKETGGETFDDEKGAHEETGFAWKEKELHTRTRWIWRCKDGGT